jgi:hypothetical protein
VPKLQPLNHKSKYRTSEGALLEAKVGEQLKGKGNALLARCPSCSTTAARIGGDGDGDEVTRWSLRGAEGWRV